MSKYIIELDDRIKLVTSVGVTENGVVYTTSDYVHNLEELNSDYINEHYGSLQDDAYKQGYAEAERIWRAPSSDNEFYQKGLEDAWEAAKKLFSSMADSDIEKAFPIEWNNGGFKALMNLQPQEAIDKLKAYEDGKHSDRIEVGDEVIWTTDNITLIATSTYKAGSINWCDGVAKDGKVYRTLIENDRKTGKHYDIQSILEAMRT